MAAVTVVVFLAAYLLVLLVRVEGRLRSLDGETAAILGELGRQYRRNAELRELRRRVGSADYVEEQARGELGMIRRGEIPFAPPPGFNP